MHPPPTFMGLGLDAVGFSGLGELPDLLAAAQRRYNGVWPEELRLAYELVHSALADTNSESRWVLTVTAIEALIPLSEKRSDLSCILDELIAVVDQLTPFDEDLREDVKKILEFDKTKSINQFGRDLAERLSGTYDDKEPKPFFSKSYGTCRGLAHGMLRETQTLANILLARVS